MIEISNIEKACVFADTRYQAKTTDEGGDVCGHQHRTIGAALKCLNKLQSWHNGACNAHWYYGHIEHADGTDLTEYEQREEMYLENS